MLLKGVYSAYNFAKTLVRVPWLHHIMVDGAMVDHVQEI